MPHGEFPGDGIGTVQVPPTSAVPIADVEFDRLNESLAMIVTSPPHACEDQGVVGRVDLGFGLHGVDVDHAGAVTA